MVRMTWAGAVSGVVTSAMCLLATGCAQARWTMRTPIQAVIQSPPPGLAAALPVGATAPDAELKDSAGQPWVLAEQRRRGPVVLLFYRGAW